MRIERSTDGGQTWQQVSVFHTECLFEQPSTGHLFACSRDRDLGLFRSTDDGQTWVLLGPLPETRPAAPVALAEHPAAGPGGAPRLILNMLDGLAYSDDGGETATESNIFEPFRWFGVDVMYAGHGPQAGMLFASSDDFFAFGEAVILASADGGETWEERSRLGFDFVYALVLGPDGALYAGQGQPAPGAVRRSVDGGRTWEAVDEGYTGEGVLDLAVGSDGRLYLAGGGGVWRTTEPLPVSTEAGPEAEAGASLEVAPNPFRGRATVAFEQSVRGAVRVAVYDVLGRRVAVLAEGRYAAGRHEVIFDPDPLGLPSGVYLVRLETEGTVRTQRVTLLR